MGELISPDLFMDVAERVHRNEAIVTGVESNGFVLQHSRGKCTFVGYHEGDDVYVVGKMWSKSETINRNDPRLKTSKNEYVVAKLYRMTVSDPEDNDETVERIAETIDEKEYDEYVDKGYINGYRLTSLDSVLGDVFRWYGK